MVYKPSYLLIFASVLFFFANDTSANELTEYSTNLEWEIVNTNEGVERYTFDDKPDLPSNPIIIGDTAHWLFGNAFNRGASAQNTHMSMDLLSGEIKESFEMGQNFLSGNATISYKGRLFSVGGKPNTITHSLNHVVEFDPMLQEWRQLSASPLARFGSQAHVYDNKIYVFGGYGYDTFNEGNVVLDDDNRFSTVANESATWRQDIQVYDIHTDEWTLADAAPDIPIFWESTKIDDTAYFATEVDWVTPSETLHHYNFSEGSWGTITLPTSLTQTKITSVGHLLIVYGMEQFYTGPNSHWLAYIYDTRAQQWYLGATLPEPDELSGVFSIVGAQHHLYLFHLPNQTTNKQSETTYRLTFDIDTPASEEYEPKTELNITKIPLQNGDSINISESGNVANLVVANTFDYEQVLKGEDTPEQRASLRRLTGSIYEKLNDDYDFIFFIFDESEKIYPNAPYGYHRPVKNDIQGIGQGIFDFSESYGSDGNLESIVVLSTNWDLMYGPSLHEMAHRWGNYLSMPLDSLRHSDWYDTYQLDPYHWTYLSNAGQLGGWRDDYFYGDLSTPSQNNYILTNSPEGLVGLSSAGPGNNFIKYSPLELYLMGLIASDDVPDLIEPTDKPIETDLYPIFQIDNFNTISMSDIIATNGQRTPDVTSSPKSLSALFVVVSKSDISQDAWNNYSYQVNNFSRPGQDDHQRLNNFWEATNGLATLYVPDLTFYVRENDYDLDGIPNDIDDDDDGDGISDEDEIALGLDPLDASDAAQDLDGDGFSNVLEYMLSLSISEATSSPVSTGVFVSYEQNERDPLFYSHSLLLQDEQATNALHGEAFMTHELNNVDEVLSIKVRGRLTDGKVGFAYQTTNADDVLTNVLVNGVSVNNSGIITDLSNGWFYKTVDVGQGNATVEIRIRSNIDNDIVQIKIDALYFPLSLPFVKADYNGDGRAELAVRSTSKFINYSKVLGDDMRIEQTFGRQATDIPINGDFDGDGIADFAIRRPTNNTFYALLSSSHNVIAMPLGTKTGDIPVVADYDGDGISDIALRRPSTGQWIIQKSSDNQLVVRSFGRLSSDIPVAADYDGDGKDDIAVRRPSNGTWYVRQSTNGSIKATRFGLLSTDIPVPADYDGDGKADIAVRRNSNGTWYILQSSDGQIRTLRFGIQSTDITVASDYDGDGTDDIAIRKPSSGLWYVLMSSSNKIEIDQFGGSAALIPMLAPMATKLNLIDTSNVVAPSSRRTPEQHAKENIWFEETITPKSSEFLGVETLPELSTF
ncbi:glycoside hydrolase family 5 [Glaciecola sp. KUL10]|nr:glycoside hydrolase family 5 [Glaciecola sp. KUL10]